MTTAARASTAVDELAVVGATDVEDVASDLAAAFATDAIVNWFLRADAGRDEARLDMFRAAVRRALGKGRIDRPAGGGAAALWMPSETLVVARRPLRRRIRIWHEELRLTGLARFTRFMAVRRDLSVHHPMSRPHAYLSFIGVAPWAQGRGQGSRLLQSAAARLDAARQPAFLETPAKRALKLYLRHGFEIVSEHRPRADGPLIWSMWREPRTPT